jgi:hypothetical protein
MSGLSDSVFEMQAKAISMLKSKKYQPAQVALATGLSKTWIELKAQAMGMIPLTVQKVEVRRK